MGLEARYTSAANSGEAAAYNRVKLVDEKGQPIKAKNLTTKEAYIFNYPYKGTPAFLINLPATPQTGITLQADSGDYVWRGGCGPDGRVVAVTAICAHQLSYPTKDHSPINYYATEPSEDAGKTGVIVCCEHDRIYDPAQGGKMTATSKKATQPLAAIDLEYDPATDELYAKGVYGGARFDDFFKAYKRELMEAFGPGVANEPVADTSAVMLMSQFSADRDQC